MQNGFLRGKLIGRLFRVETSGHYPVVHDTTGMERFWQKCKAITPENEQTFRVGWLFGAGFPLPEQDWRGYDG